MTSINDLGQNVNPVLSPEGSSTGVKPKITPFYTLFLMLVIASIFFALGRLSVLNSQKQPIKVINPAVLGVSQTASVINSQPESSPGGPLGEIVVNTENTSSGVVVGSKTGKKYYFPWCGTVKRIKPENLIQFSSIEDARAKGYTPAENCAGLK